MILITGASGKTGKAVIRTLAGQGKKVRALVFRTEQIQEAKEAGAREVITGDMRDEDCVQKALKDVQSVYHICPNVHPDEISIGRSLINGSIANGIQHFVYHSVLHPQIEAMPHHWNKMRVEEYLISSGLPFTILQPAVYMQNILAGWTTIMTAHEYAVPYSLDSRLAMVDLEDVANAAAAILDQESKAGPSPHLGASYELAGCPAISAKEIALILSKQLGFQVHARSLTIGEWRQRVKGTGLDDYRLSTLEKMFAYYDQYGFVGNSQTLSGLLHRPATNLETFVARTIRESTEVKL